jgi:AraC-like DNA-binding protein
MAMTRRVQADAAPQGAVHIWHEGILFLGTGIRNAPHRHFTASLIFAIEGTFAFRSGGSKWRPVRAIVTGPNALQQMDSGDSRVAIMQIDPETEAYVRLAWLFTERGNVFEPEPAVADALVSTARSMLENPQFDPARLWAYALDCVGGEWHRPLVLDPRVTRVLDLMKRDFPAAPKVSQLAAEVQVSPGRLIHLWKEQLGVPLRRYMLWLRLRHVVACVGIGKSLTEAAYEAGFADSAHLSRTFRSMFGLPLSSLFGTTTKVQLFFKFPEQELSGPHGPYDRERWDTAAKVLRRRSSTSGPSGAA